MLKLILLFFPKGFNVNFFNLREIRIKECLNKFKSATYDFQKQSHWAKVTLGKVYKPESSVFHFQVIIIVPFSF